MQPYLAAVRLERDLGSPKDDQGIFSFRRSIELDERDEFPQAACDLLDTLGLPAYYVPEADGGKLTSFAELAAIFRVVARRDLTVAIAHHKTFLGAIHVWTAGTPRQREQMAAHVQAGGRVALCYHEKEHGGDLAATETTAVRLDDGRYSLTGEKWFVNNATLADVHTVFARTGGRSARAFSLFLVDKRKLAEGTFLHLPRLKTHGARGADFSGIRYWNAELDPDSLVGREGAALELTLRSFQVTRSLVPALSLGAADTALRTVLEFAIGRTINGKSVFDLPLPRRIILDAFADLLICDILVAATARALHIATEEMRLWSAVSKFLVPSIVDEMISRLAEVLGARSFLREDARFGIFEKIQRDHRAVPLFHAGGHLLLQTVGLALPQLASLREAGTTTERKDFGEVLDAIFTSSRPLPHFEASRLKAYARFRDPLLVLERFPLDVEAAREDASFGGDAADVLISLAAALLDASADQDQRLGRGQQLDPEAPEFFELCRRHCILQAAAACAHTWVCNRRSSNPALSRGEWLAPCLGRLLERLGVRTKCRAPASTLFSDLLMQLYLDGKSFSILPMPIAV